MQRMEADERLQLGHELRVAAEREVGVDPPFERSEARGLEPLCFRLRENVVGELGEGLAAPEPERLAEQPARLGGIGAFRLADQLLETEQVELVGVEPDQIAGLLRHDRCAVSEQLPQLRDVVLERVRSCGRRVTRPQRVDQAVDRDGRVRGQQKEGEQRSLLRAAQGHGASFVHDFERPQDPEFHRLPSTATMNLRPASGKAQAGLSDRRRVGGTRMDVSTPVDIGSDFLGYRIEELIGRGGMGVVYRAYDLRLKRPVALKLVAPSLARDERFRERFARESELVMSLEHPNVVPIYDAGDVDDRVYLAMRLVDGSDLGALLRTEGALEPARAIAICTQIAAALDAAHARGLVHRDVKPSNVLLDGSEHVYLADFGLTRRLDDDGAWPARVHRSARPPTSRPSSSNARPSTAARTSTRSAACSTSA